jgi:hypothetical protein
MWWPLRLCALRAVRVAALLDTDGGPRLPPQVLGGRLQGGLALPGSGQRQRQASLRWGGRGLHGAGPRLRPGGPRPFQAAPRSAVRKPTRLGPRGCAWPQWGHGAPGTDPGALRADRPRAGRHGFLSAPGTRLRAQLRSPRSAPRSAPAPTPPPRPAPPCPPARRGCQRRPSPPPSRPVGGSHPRRGALSTHAEPRSRRGGGAGTRLSPERLAKQWRSRATKS